MQKTTTLITGATGFIGRWLILDLVSQGNTVTALMRKPETQLPELKSWIRQRGGDAEKIVAIKGDLSKENLGLTEQDFNQLNDLHYIFHLGAVMQWNLDINVAREANVRPIKLLCQLAERSPNFKRFVQMTGFMIASETRAAELGLTDVENVSDKHWLSLYKRLGSYEASKYEAHFQLLSHLQAKSIPYTVINPGVVIGHSVTGETIQYDSIVSMIHALYKGEVPAIPGTDKDWLPAIPVDYVAKFTAGIINQPESINQQYTLLDDRTPDLASMLAILSRHFHVPVVKSRIPVALLKGLAKVGLERFLPLPTEPLSFISSYDFDIKNSQSMAAQMGLSLPGFEEYFGRFADYLMKTHFLQDDVDQSSQMVNSPNGKVYLAGNTDDPQFVLLHGLPLNSDSWAAIENRYPGKTLRIDIPGLGRSTYSEANFVSWLSNLMASLKSRPIVVGHSLGTAFATQLAHRHPERVSGIVLIAPYFLGKAPAKWMTTPAAFKAITKLIPKKKLRSFIEGEGPGVENARAQLLLDADSRSLLPAIAYWLNYAWKNAKLFRKHYSEVQVPSILIAGEKDLPKDVTGLPLKVIASAGHNPHITHPLDVIDVLESEEVVELLGALQDDLRLVAS